MKNFQKRILLFLLAAAIISGCFVSCAPVTADPITYPDRPAMWEVTKPGSKNVLYLFGSIHAADESAFPLDEDITAAFNRCDALAVEVDVVEIKKDPSKAAEMAQYLLYVDGGTVLDVIDQELLNEISALVMAEGANEGIPESMFPILKPSALSSFLTNVAIKRAGLSAVDGIDMYFLELAGEKEMKILEVESMEMQMKLLSELPAELDVLLLKNSLDAEKSGAQLRELYEAWKSGDMDVLLASSETSGGLTPEEIKLYEDYNKLLLADRNGPMADKAEEYFASGEKVFFVVGALHMVGDDGVVNILLDRGYKVTRK